MSQETDSTTPGRFNVSAGTGATRAPHAEQPQGLGATGLAAQARLPPRPLLLPWRTTTC